MNTSIRFGSALLGMTLASALHAETLVQYDFPTNIGGATTIGSNVETSQFTGGIARVQSNSTSTGNPGRSVYATGEQVTNASSDWFGFTISADENYKLNLETLTFAYAFSYSGGVAPTTAATFDVRSSLDWNTSLAVFSANPTSGTTPAWETASVSLTAAAFQGLDTPIEFRVYLTDGTNISGTSYIRMDAVSLSGMSVAIPEPSTYALLGGVGVLGLAVLRRRRQAA